MKFTLGECSEWISGELHGDWDLGFAHIFADSRLCQPPSLFVGITGPNFDGADFIKDAVANGAVAALVADKDALHGLPGIVCDDPIAALGRMAKAYRAKMDIPWVAVTGSNGKTTTRELLKCILEAKGSVACSVRNYNNRIGVPLSILSAPEDSWAGVIELGTNAPGEIEELSEILNPTIGIITSIGSSHLAGLKTVKGVAEEKSKIFEQLPEDGLAVFPADCQYRNIVEEKICQCAKPFSVDDESGSNGDISATDIICSEDGLAFKAWDTEFNVSVSGRHNVGNVLSAVVVADWLGITPSESAEKLKGFHCVSGRMNIIRIGQLTILDDTYNANPESMCAAVKFLCEIPARRRVCFVGYMGELGEQSEKLHRELGYLMARSGIDLLVTMGQDTVSLAESASTRAAGCKVHYFPSVTAVLPKIIDFIQPDDTILVKGSRKAKMERVVKVIADHFAKNKGDSGRKADNA
ncbi:MAG: UDP-N-acetylmuramoyl-tripeptide--D-alanyl-D-alanine ligase [Planctomycetota bacterium]|jgi:UDP-N-acetylmuramoyl-tripeptide--D-alanyl-D-alanine ligase